MKEMTVYVVTTESMGYGVFVEGVFATREEAEAVADHNSEVHETVFYKES
jgi:hypothetical protein